MSTREQDVAEQVDIEAPRERVWAAVSDPAAYRRWSPESAGIRRLDGERPEPWGVGQRFVGVNRVWVPWVTVCRVVAADEDAGRFAFDVDLGPFPVATWAYELEELPDGRVRVTERWHDRREGLRGAVMRPAGLLVGRGRDAAVRNRTTMRATLAALRADLESRAG